MAAACFEVVPQTNGPRTSAAPSSQRVAAGDDEGRCGDVPRRFARQVDRQRAEVARLAEVARGIWLLNVSMTAGFSRAEEGPLPKMIDFGVAKAIGQPLIE